MAHLTRTKAFHDGWYVSVSVMLEFMSKNPNATRQQIMSHAYTLRNIPQNDELYRAADGETSIKEHADIING